MGKSEEEMIEILGKIIDLLRSEGIAVDSPYDLENFMEDWGNHSNQFDTGRFPDFDKE